RMDLPPKFHMRRIDGSCRIPILNLLFRNRPRPKVGAFPMNDAIRKAETLIEALSYIRQFRNRLIVIKLGGSAMEEPDALQATLQDVIFMATVGLRPIV